MHTSLPLESRADRRGIDDPSQERSRGKKTLPKRLLTEPWLLYYTLVFGEPRSLTWPVEVTRDKAVSLIPPSLLRGREEHGGLVNGTVSTDSARTRPPSTAGPCGNRPPLMWSDELNSNKASQRLLRGFFCVASATLTRCPT